MAQRKVDPTTTVVKTRVVNTPTRSRTAKSTAGAERLENRDEEHTARIRALTAELTEIRQALRIEIKERSRAESQLAALKKQFAEELSGMLRLHELSTRFAVHGTKQELLDHMMDTAIAITAADMGTLQLFNAAEGALKIVAQRGFDLPFCNFFENVHDGDAACGTALQYRKRVFVEDITRSPIFLRTTALNILLAAGVRAVQSTPLINRSGELIGMVSTHYHRPHRAKEHHLRLLDLLARQAADFLEHVRSEETLQRSRQELRNLAVRLQRATEKERELLAWEIHDELSGSLTALKMDLSLLPGRLAKNRRSFDQKIKSMEDLIDHMFNQVQTIVTGLRPVVLDKSGLTAAIEWQAREFQRRFAITCETFLPPYKISLDADRSTALFRIFQEALTNVARHSGASKAVVELKTEGNSLVLQVRDNGKGIDEKKLCDDSSIGLLSIRERVLSYSGTVEIRRLPEGGTLVRAEFPMKPQASMTR